MKTYDFFCGGSAGKGDTWDYEFSFDLTDEEAERLEAAARKHPELDFDENPDVRDIYDKVYAAAYENELDNIPDDLLEDERSDFLAEEGIWGEPEYSNVLGCWIKRAAPVTRKELAERYFDGLSFSVNYPLDLQELEEEDDDE